MMCDNLRDKENRLNIGIFGYQETGKTSLIHVWCNEPVNNEYIRTTEMEYSELNVTVLDTTIPLTFGDCGFEVVEKFMDSGSTALPFLKVMNILIFVFATNSIDSYNFLEGSPSSVFFNPGANVEQYVILNMNDLEEKDETKNLVKEHAEQNNMPFFVTSTKNPDGCKTVLNKIVNSYFENNPNALEKFKNNPLNKNTKKIKSQKRKSSKTPQSSHEVNNHNDKKCCTIV
ncbi:hypothetical protein EIN_274350 [Entamoeba invadens IP1]|uniref:Uncharacterized protein n=1 Tax=Entamoeba invadens IP1 TaxID=370355 RepID=A0A0A1U4Q0_ENTIV|nr:hypothetical protein EIN_274350 [Entamoeba invadens IP1]ELP87868.1 hypothetical protein EIN_274350 [Entamoeba invadens IP1]|eukprot:XP_004254639.1 hypothetical protein EIN_274350 [Entamoeba invadens IP1]